VVVLRIDHSGTVTPSYAGQSANAPAFPPWHLPDTPTAGKSNLLNAPDLCQVGLRERFVSTRSTSTPSRVEIAGRDYLVTTPVGFNPQQAPPPLLDAFSATLREAMGADLDRARCRRVRARVPSSPRCSPPVSSFWPGGPPPSGAASAVCSTSWPLLFPTRAAVRGAGFRYPRAVQVSADTWRPGRSPPDIEVRIPLRSGAQCAARSIR